MMFSFLSLLQNVILESIGRIESTRVFFQLLEDWNSPLGVEMVSIVRRYVKP